jgi:HK97 family phage prohead protease
MQTRSITLERSDSGPIPCVLTTADPVQRTDEYGERFDEVLACTPDAVDTTRVPLPLLISHNSRDLPIGQIVNIRATGRELRGELVLGKSARAREIEPDVRSGLISSLSVGYVIQRHRRQGDTLTATRWQPHEVSLVAVPADPRAGTYRSKSNMTTEVENDLDTDTRLSRSQKRAIREQEELDREAEARELRAEKRIQTRERDRINHIHSAVEGLDIPAEMVRSWIDDGRTVAECRSEIIEALKRKESPPMNPRISVSDTITARDRSSIWGSTRDTTDHGNIRSAMIDGLALRSGATLKAPSSDARQFAGLSLVDLAAQCLGNRGTSVQTRNPSEILSRALTTSDFPLLMSGLANKVLQNMREADPASHQMWCKFTTTPDFKANSRVAVSSAPNLALKVEGAEITFGALAERGQSFTAKRYARGLVMTRESMVNDDLRAFEVAARGFAQSALRLEADLVYQQITTNPTMADGGALFNATAVTTVGGHANLLTGATTAFDATNALVALAAARAAMRKQKDPAGHGYLDVKPAYLLLPVGMETLAESIVSSLSRIDGSNATVNNPGWIRNLTIVTDPRLDAHNAAYWYIAASSQQVDTVEVCHLEGTNQGFTATEEVDFNTDNLAIKATWEGTASVVDWAGLLRSNGA